MATETRSERELFGHPTGLFTLFFAEMWERFSYYGMRALLLFYMIKGFLGYGDSDAYAVYGAYTALVYMTPFFGGMLADKLLGARRAVVLGGLLMATGHLLMTVENSIAFFVALAFLIAGNGFFKPNISTIVGSLYKPGSPGRDGGFTIFYVGINLGAAMSPLLCGYIGETYGWHYGFGLATLGMLTGLSVFVAPARVTQVLIMAAALGAAGGLLTFRPDNGYLIAVNVFVALYLVAAAVVAWMALSRGGLPSAAGAPPDMGRLKKPMLGPLSAEYTVYAGTFALVPVFALLVSGMSLLTSDHKQVVLFSDELIKQMSASASPVMQIVATVVAEASKPAGLILLLAGLLAVVYLGFHTFKQAKIARERMFVALILTFFSMLFWAFFEQAGSSINNFTDRNVDRVEEAGEVVPADVGKTIKLQPSQEQLGYTFQGKPFTLSDLDKIRDEHKDNPAFEIDWTLAADNVGMKVAKRNDEVPASVFQAVNPVGILILGLLFSALWTFLGKRGAEPSTPFKFALGLLQLGAGFGALWYGAQNSDSRGMVGVTWLVLGYLLHTTGELCLSPVGLSMITRLSPAFLVSTMMGTWFLATAFSQYLAAIISQFTGVGHGGDGGGAFPVPKDTVHVYGDVFGNIAIAATVSAAICFSLVPLLKKWMHTDAESAGDGARAGH